MSYATVCMFVVVLAGCSSDSTQHWTALVDSKEGTGSSFASYVDLDLAEDDASTFGRRSVVETEGAGTIEITSVPATWEPDHGDIAVHIDETATPTGGTVPAMDVPCEADAQALVCTFEGRLESTTYTFEEREEEPVPDERWRLGEWWYGYGSTTYPIESTYQDKNGTWTELLSMALVRDGSDVTWSSTDMRFGAGSGALYTYEQQMYGTWTGDAQPHLQFDAQKATYECQSDGDSMTCVSQYGDQQVWQRE